MDEQEKQQSLDFCAEGPGSSKMAPSPSEALSQHATASAEAAKGKKPAQGEVVSQKDASVTDTRPGSVFDLVKETPKPPSVESSRSNSTRPNFQNLLDNLEAAKAASQENNDQLAFAKLYEAQKQLDLVTPEDVRNIRNDLDKLERAMPLETDSGKLQEMKQRVIMGTRILESLWECPLRLALGTVKVGVGDDQALTEACKLLQQAAKANKQLVENSELKQAVEQTIEKYSDLYGGMKQPVQGALKQALAMGAESGGIQMLSAFQKDPQLVERLFQQGRKAQLDSPDPYVHAREAQQLMKSKGVLSLEARQEHDRSIELAKKVKNTDGKSFNLLMVDIAKTKYDITSKETALAALKEQIAKAKRESKAMAAEIMVTENERAAEDKKSQSKNMLEAGWTNFNRTLRAVTGDQEKLDNAHNAKVAEMVKKGNELRALETQRKALEGEIKASQDSLKGKQTKLADIGKPIADKHVGYAKALLKDADACTVSADKAHAENNKDEFDKSQALQIEDIVAAAQQLNRAEKISPQLANDEELKTLKRNFSLVTTSIGENIKGITPNKQQELDDRFLRVVNLYNQHRDDKLHEAMKQPNAKLTEFQTVLMKELMSYRNDHAELAVDPKLLAAMRLIGKGEEITDEALSQESTVVFKSLKVLEGANTGALAMQQFEALMAAKQYKDAEEVLKVGLENLKPVHQSLKDKLAESETAFASCASVEQLDQLRKGKQAQETAVSECESTILNSIGSLYLTPDRVKQKDGSEVAGPGYKPEQAIKALNEAKTAFPGIEKNDLFQKQMEMAQDLQKGIKEMEIKAAEDAEKFKEAGIDLTTAAVSTAGAALVGAGATVLLIGSAPVTLPLAAAVVGITAVGGAVFGAVTKVGLANALDAKNKNDVAGNLSSGAVNGFTSGLGTGGLKMAGMAVTQSVKFASVADKVSKFAPLEQTAANILKGANGNVAKEVQLGEQILEAQLKRGKITEQTFNTAKSWLSAKGVNGAPTNTADILQTAGVSLDEMTLTAAGLKMEAAAGANGARAIDAGWEALKAGLPQANNSAYAWYNVPGKMWNVGKTNVSNLNTLASYAAPYVAKRTALAALPLAAASGTYNTAKYGSKVASGEINQETGEQWTTGDALNATLTNTAIDTGISLGTIGALRLAAGNPAAVMDMKTMGAASFTSWVANKATRGGLSNMTAKMSNAGPMMAIKYENAGIVAPFLRNVIPISAPSMKLVVATANTSDKTSRELASSQSGLTNFEMEVAEAPQQEIAEQPAPQTEGAPKPEAIEQNNEVASAETSNQPNSATNSEGPPAPITDS